MVERFTSRISAIVASYTTTQYFHMIDYFYLQEGIGWNAMARAAIIRTGDVVSRLAG